MPRTAPAALLSKSLSENQNHEQETWTIPIWIQFGHIGFTHNEQIENDIEQYEKIPENKSTNGRYSYGNYFMCNLIETHSRTSDDKTFSLHLIPGGERLPQKDFQNTGIRFGKIKVVLLQIIDNGRTDFGIASPAVISSARYYRDLRLVFADTRRRHLIQFW